MPARASRVLVIIEQMRLTSSGIVALLLFVGPIGVLIAAQIATAVLTVCLNETPVVAQALQEVVPASASTARGVLSVVDQLAAQSTCDTANHARAMAAAGVAYIVAVLALERARLSRSWQLFVIGATAAVIQFALLLMPALLSGDVVSYAAYGRVATIHNANPYVWPPDTFAGDAFANGAWGGAVTVYGPLWTHIDATIAGMLPGGDVAQIVSAYKLLALAANAANIWVIWWLAGRWGSPMGVVSATQAQAVALYAWNPLVNIELVGNAHNEAIMLTLVLLGFVLLTRATEVPRAADSPQPTRQWFWLAAVACFWMGALIKFVPAAIAAIVSFVWLRRAPTGALVLKRSLMLCGLIAVLVLVVGWPWLDSSAIASPLFGVAAGGQRVNDAWQDAPAAYLAVRLLPRLQVPDDLRENVSRAIVWDITRAAFLAYVGLEGLWLWKRATADAACAVRAIAIASVRVLLLAVLLFVSQVYAWYFLWPLPIACVLGLREPWSRAAIVFGLAFLPAFYLREFEPYGIFYLPLYGLATFCALAAMWVEQRLPKLVHFALGIRRAC